MPAATVANAPATTNGAAAQGGQPVPTVPFMQGTYEYSEIIDTYTYTMAATQGPDHTIQITPGGFLRGVSLYCTGAGGAFGGGAAADAPWNVFVYITLESIDGTPIKYPLGGYAYYLESRICRPWDGDPATDPVFSAGPDPTFRLRYFLELRSTIAVVPNTDARAQYRIRYAVNTIANVQTAGGGVGSALTIITALETYAQPPQMTLSGAQINPVPDGITIQRFQSHESGIPTTAGDTTQKSNRTGNLLRTVMYIWRTAAGARVDLTADPLRWRLDNTQLVVEQRTRRDFEFDRFFASYGGAMRTRPTGVYPYMRWHNPGQMHGQSWLETSEASYLSLEYIGGPAGGTLEVLTEDLAPMAPIPANLESI